MRARTRRWCCLTASMLTATRMVGGYTLDPNSTDSIKSVASQMAEDMMTFYNGNKPGFIPGMLEPPYYWWEAGALMGALIDYWYYTGDDKYNDIITQGMLFQVGPGRDYMTPNQTLTEGNDDQGFWGMAAMSAAEYKFPNPPADQPQWLALAQAVFNTQAFRWDTEHCGGGLRWQIFTWNNGWNYKNSISQACFFNLAARLALYTGNASYAAWADKTWDWMVDRGLMDAKYNIFDGAYIESNCTEVTLWQFSYNPGAFLLGAAAMYNYSASLSSSSTTTTTDNTGGTPPPPPDERDKWQARVRGLLAGVRPFFNASRGDVMQEVSCEDMNRCNTDQLSFKGYLSRWMAATTKWAPFATDKIMAYLRPSAVAAAKQCVGGPNKRMCGFRWTGNGSWDGTTGLGQQMSAMEVVLATMIHDLPPPVTNETGGTSQGDPGAGGSDIGRTSGFNALEFMTPITAADKAGAYLCTVAVLASLVAGVAFMLMDEKKTSSDTKTAVAEEHWSDVKKKGHMGGFGGAEEAAAAAAAVVSRQSKDDDMMGGGGGGGGAPPPVVAKGDDDDDDDDDMDRSEIEHISPLPSPIETPDPFPPRAAANTPAAAAAVAAAATVVHHPTPSRISPFRCFDPPMPWSIPTHRLQPISSEPHVHVHSPFMLPPPAVSMGSGNPAPLCTQGQINNSFGARLAPLTMVTSVDQLPLPPVRPRRDRHAVSDY